MDNSSDASVIVERMILKYLSASEEKRLEMLGAEQAKHAWKIIRDTLVEQEKEDYAVEFEKAPLLAKDRLVSQVAKFMRRDDQIAIQLNNAYDEYLRVMYSGSGSITIQQDSSQIDNISGVTIGETVINVNPDNFNITDLNS